MIELHRLEDEARWLDPESSEYFDLMRQYARALNAAWQQPLSSVDLVEHERRRPHPATGPDHFRPQTILRNLANEIEYVGCYYNEERARWFQERGLKDRQRKPKGDLPTLARKAASAARRLRPDLFDAA